MTKRDYSLPAKRFLPHSASTTVAGDLPQILISEQALDDMYYIVDLSPDEVGWIGTVERLAGNAFLIKEVFLIDQEVNSSTCELTAEGMALFVEEMMSARPDGFEIVNSLRFWGHSHVRMGTSPSSQDDQQFRELSTSCDDFFVRGILNKNGRMQFDVRILDVGLTFLDVSWGVYRPRVDDQRRLEIQNEISRKVRKIRYVPVSRGKGQENGNGTSSIAGKSLILDNGYNLVELEPDEWEAE